MKRYTEDEAIAAIRQHHLKANIAEWEEDDQATIDWEKAWLDPGGTLFGLGPYAKVPVSIPTSMGRETLIVRVYAPARLRRRLARALGYA